MNGRFYARVLGIIAVMAVAFCITVYYSLNGLQHVIEESSMTADNDLI